MRWEAYNDKMAISEQIKWLISDIGSGLNNFTRACIVIRNYQYTLILEKPSHQSGKAPHVETLNLAVFHTYLTPDSNPCP